MTLESYASLFVIKMNSPHRKCIFSFILGQHAVVTSSDLPTKLQALSTSDEATEVDMRDQPGTSKS